MEFTINDITSAQQSAMINSGVWKAECPVNISRLKMLHIGHYNFDGQIQLGKMVVLDSIAKPVLNIFQELLTLKFSIHLMLPMEAYSGSDELSMQANNSSCFNFRNIAGSDKLSLHSYGLALDVNPIQNPYIINKGTVSEVLPHQGVDFLNRADKRPGMIEEMVPIFIKHGFTEWGGNWDAPDYHHFQIPRGQINQYL